jgi:hypothetical protein
MAIANYVIFCDQRRRLIPIRDLQVAEKAYFIAVVFADQKNSKKLDARTQRKTGDPYLCPVLRWVVILQRLI